MKTTWKLSTHIHEIYSLAPGLKILNPSDGTSSSSTSCLGADSPNSTHDLQKPLFLDGNGTHTQRLPVINSLVGYSEPHMDNNDNKHMRTPWTTSTFHYGPHHNIIYPVDKG